MRAYALATLVALCGCTSQAEQAEKQYNIVKNTGSAADVCAQGQAVVAAHLQAQDAQRYAERRVATDIECANARDEERMGIFRMPDGSKKVIEADNLDAFPGTYSPKAESVGNDTSDPSNPCYKASADC